MSAIDRDKNLAKGSVIVKNESAVKTCEEGANKTDVFNSVTCDFARETRLVLLPEAFPTMARGQQNHIVKSGYRCEQTPDLTI